MKTNQIERICREAIVASRSYEDAVRTLIPRQMDIKSLERYVKLPEAEEASLSWPRGAASKEKGAGRGRV